MKPFNILTKWGKTRRLRSLALNALAQYPLDFERFALVGQFTNTLFRVVAMNGVSYVLRICRPGWRTDEDLLSEMMWLQALANETDIGAPLPQEARNGEFTVQASADGVPEPRCCQLMSWIPGVLLAKQLNEKNLGKMGLLFARLHKFSESYHPLPGFTRRKMSVVFARGEEDGISHGLKGDIRTGSWVDVSIETRITIIKTWDLVNETLSELYANPAGLRVIHNDLWHENIKVDHGRLRPLDFEDTVWGYPTQDIAMAFQDLMMAVEPDTFVRFCHAFRQGYETLTPWPEIYPGEIDTLRAGRMIWVVNYVAQNQPQYLRQHLEWTAAIFTQFLDKKIIRLR